MSNPITEVIAVPTQDGPPPNAVEVCGTYELLYIHYTVYAVTATGS